MKYKKILMALLLMLSGSSADIWAQVKMNAYSQMVLSTVKDKSVSQSCLTNMSVKTDGHENLLEAFIEVDDPSVLDELQAKGVRLQFRCGDVTTASIPVSIIDDVLATQGLTNIQFARTMRPKNDKARKIAKVDEVHAGTGISSAYKGKGVIYGSIDDGIDFNHAAFKDTEGNSRILLAYLPSASTPETGAVSNYTIKTTDDGKTYYNVQLPGYIYSTEYIKNITTGSNSASHGTHTAGTAAGGTYGSSTFYGMAPEASLILSDGRTTDTNILNSVALTFYEATKRQMPAVVNLSLGGNIGTHDSTDAFNKAINNLCGKGKIVVTASGNEADHDMSLQKEANATLASGIKALDRDTGKMSWTSLDGIIDMWGRDGKSFSLKLSLLNSALGTSKNIYNSETATSPFVIDCNAYEGMNNGFIRITNSDPSSTSNGNRNISIDLNNLKLNSDYKLAIELSGESYVNVWGDNGDVTFAAPEGFSGYTSGNTLGSYNSMVCYDNAISVGAMNSRDTYEWAGDGMIHRLYEQSKLGEMTFFSSYGTDEDGRVHPTVVAAGCFVSSAYNSYDSDSKLTGNADDHITQYDEKDGRIQPYGLNQGTSMAAPVAAGIIALWLEKNPALTPTDVKNIIAMTAVSNDQLKKKAGQMGDNGMIDAQAGINSITTGIIDAITNGNDAVVLSSGDGFNVLATGNSGNALVEVFTAAGVPVLSNSIPCNTTRHFSLPATSGIYLVTVTTSGYRVTKKLCK